MNINKYLMDNGITVVGTMRTDRKGIPPGMKDVKNRTVPSTLYAWNADLKSVLVSYVVKTSKGKRNVMVMSHIHENVLVTKDDRKTLHVITFYDKTKGGVDIWRGRTPRGVKREGGI